MPGACSLKPRSGFSRHWGQRAWEQASVRVETDSISATAGLSALEITDKDKMRFGNSAVESGTRQVADGNRNEKAPETTGCCSPIPDVLGPVGTPDRGCRLWARAGCGRTRSPPLSGPLPLRVLLHPAFHEQLASSLRPEPTTHTHTGAGGDGSSPTPTRRFLLSQGLANGHQSAQRQGGAAPHG